MDDAVAEQFTRFVRAHDRALLRAGWLLTGDWAAAEDLVQTAFERTLPRWSRLGDDARRAGYLRKVMMTSYLRHARRRSASEVVTDDPARSRESSGEPDVALQASVLAALDRLPATQRAVLVLRYLLDQSEAATAAALGIRPGTVKSAAARGLAALRADPATADLLGEGVIR